MTLINSLRFGSDEMNEKEKNTQNKPEVFFRSSSGV
jgi:hypothetical protein